MHACRELHLSYPTHQNEVVGKKVADQGKSTSNHMQRQLLGQPIRYNDLGVFCTFQRLRQGMGKSMGKLRLVR